MAKSCLSENELVAATTGALIEQLLFFLIPIMCWVRGRRYFMSKMKNVHFALYAFLFVILLCDFQDQLFVLQPPLFIYVLISTAVSHLVVAVCQFRTRQVSRGLVSLTLFGMLLRLMSPLACQDAPFDMFASTVLLILSAGNINYIRKLIINNNRLPLLLYS
eukprot:TRINITY_DN20651_c0_g1_i1.p1 TRINITY_DN20651_c0_g1~~TRINITY_DN20651_c0_g1_i1.p1  ORF type:complete len:162 (+),score=13.06 TRINITY_DN20651_c0_g1_i1:1013-1498(+)